MNEKNPLRVGFLGFEGLMALDLVGPIDAFKSAFVEDRNGEVSNCYEVVIIGLSGRPFTSESGVVFQPHKTIKNAPPLDTLIIPGGKGLRVFETQRKAAGWISSRAATTRRIATVCTGTFGLAATGLLNGRCVTTHWRQAQELAQRFPELKVDPNALYLKDGKFYTCAGITAGIDLSLALIEEDFGPRVALSVARELVVYLKRPGGQEQFSEPLQFQTHSSDRFADLAAWIQGHLRQDLSAEALAERACLSPRHFTRRFKEVFSTTPAAFVEELRLREARERLTLPDQTIESVAASVGFKSGDAFRRAFERRYGLQPSSYRRHFSLHTRKLE
jgi:transcriptional regulator GlxA family with amidase domain